MSPRPTVLATAAIAATLAAFRWWPASVPPDAAAPAPPPAATGAVVVSAGPLVERSSSGGAGWIPAHPGDALGLADAIRTGHGDTAEVSLGRGTILLIDERSEVTVRELDAAAQRVQLARGRIGVEHRSEGTRVLRVEDGSGTILASSVGGRWSAVASRDSLAVAAREGAVRLVDGRVDIIRRIVYAI